MLLSVSHFGVRRQSGSGDGALDCARVNSPSSEIAVEEKNPKRCRAGGKNQQQCCVSLATALQR
ncbi:MAG: hypothetical protein ND895_13235, partial [Pyrinomonadaceae bacterium]|nr:hypothetical protein [Pyrinomonadaceae bacterium]